MLEKDSNSGKEQNILSGVASSKQLPIKDIPLDGSDRIKLILYFCLWGGTLIFGVIPILVSLGSIYIMKKDKSFSAITTSKTIINIYVILVCLVLFWAGFDSYGESYGKEFAYILFGVAVVSIFAFPPLLDFLYFSTLENKQGWIVRHGIFSDKPNEESIIDVVKNRMQRTQNTEAFSAPDELLKWKALLDKGAITEEEFKIKKAKLL